MLLEPGEPGRGVGDDGDIGVVALVAAGGIMQAMSLSRKGDSVAGSVLWASAKFDGLAEITGTPSFSTT